MKYMLNLVETDFNIQQFLNFQDKLLYFVLISLYPSLQINLKNLQFWSENLGAMLEYRCVKHGLLGSYSYKFCTGFSYC